MPVEVDGQNAIIDRMTERLVAGTPTWLRDDVTIVVVRRLDSRPAT
jgi:hypothetical protein